MRGIEPLTPSLPRKYSTPELHRLKPTHKPKTFAPGFPKSNNTLILPFIRLPVFTNLPYLSSTLFFNLAQSFLTSGRRSRWLSGSNPTTILEVSVLLSGRRGSNPRPTAWKAVALPTELLPLNLLAQNIF